MLQFLSPAQVQFDRVNVETSLEEPLAIAFQSAASLAWPALADCRSVHMRREQRERKAFDVNSFDSARLPIWLDMHGSKFVF